MDTAWEVFCMELPKNITQIGEVDRTCKVYVEDYVVSYIKQLNRVAEDKDMAVSMFGVRKDEDGISYYFVYGACKLNLLQREVRHLSQAQQQEIEKWRRQYFPELSFVGYRLLNGEMIEGFHILDQDVCRYVAGYAQFYEKNDAMLAYMLAEREEVKPEQVNQEKYDAVKKRQEERRNEAETAAFLQKKIVPMTGSINLQNMRLAAVGVFALLCLFGVATYHETSGEKNYQILDYEAEQVNASVAPENIERTKLVVEDKLEQVLQEENQLAEPIGAEAEGDDPAMLEARTDAAGQAIATDAAGQTDTSETAEQQKATDAAGQTDTSDATGQQKASDDAKQPDTTGTAEQQGPAGQAKTPEEPAEQKSVQTAASVSYVIQPGDTLIAISRRQYGTDARVKDICTTNKITNPDDIKEGQVIVLPR